MPRVLNQSRDEIPDDAVYVGRPSKWGNPFKIGVHGDREQCVELFREEVSLDTHYLHQVRDELAGKDLVCWCAPLACHAEVLLELANPSNPGDARAAIHDALSFIDSFEGEPGAFDSEDEKAGLRRYVRMISGLEQALEELER